MSKREWEKVQRYIYQDGCLDRCEVGGDLVPSLPFDALLAAYNAREAECRELVEATNAFQIWVPCFIPNTSIPTSAPRDSRIYLSRSQAYAALKEFEPYCYVVEYPLEPLRAALAKFDKEPEI